MPLHNQNTDFLDPIQIQNIDFIVRLGPSYILGGGGWWGIEKCQAPSSYTYTHNVKKWSERYCLLSGSQKELHVEMHFH